MVHALSKIVIWCIINEVSIETTNIGHATVSCFSDNTEGYSGLPAVSFCGYVDQGCDDTLVGQGSWPETG